MTIPNRFSLDKFNLMAPFIGQALERYPRPVQVPCGTLSEETIARKLREALESKKRYHFRHAMVDETLWAKYKDELTTSMREGYVLFGKDVGELVNGPVSSVYQHHILCPVAHLPALCEAWQFLEPRPTNFIVQSSDPATQAELDRLEGIFDVAFTSVSPGLWQLL